VNEAVWTRVVIGEAIDPSVFVITQAPGAPTF